MLSGSILAITSDQPTYCNITLLTDEGMASDVPGTSLALSARMVEKKAEASEMAEAAYTAYCAAVGGVAFNGDPLPNWEEFSADPVKQKQANAWIAAVEAL